MLSDVSLCLLFVAVALASPLQRRAVPDCEYNGQLQADPEDSCRFYQCIYVDAGYTVGAVSQPCAPGSSVPTNYSAGNPCTGPNLPQCPQPTGATGGGILTPECENADLDPSGECQRVGQFLFHESSRCNFYQCVYLDAQMNLQTNLMTCPEKTSVPLDYKCGNPCTGPPVACPWDV